MSQNIILTQVLNYLINKRASLELKCHWNNINMAFCVHMSHSLFCFVFIENEDITVSSNISNELCHNSYAIDLNYLDYVMPVILYTSCLRRKRVKSPRNYKIGMVMLFFLVNCILKVDICISPVHVIKSKKFKVLDHTLYISPGEIFETFVEFDDDSTMGNKSYWKHFNLARVFVLTHLRLIDFFNYFISLFSQYC